MSRPLRIEFPGALYHVTARGVRREAIFRTDDDRRLFLAIVGQAFSRLNADALAYCLMGNHYHVVLRTRQANLSRLMRHINGEYSRAFNRRHGLEGHVFQGRFHAKLVDGDAYFVEVCRYVELNPVRAGLCGDAGGWRWSSYRAHIGEAPDPAWLATRELYGHLLRRDAETIEDCRQAARLYASSVADGVGANLWQEGLRGGMFLGGDEFMAAMLARASVHRLHDAEITSPDVVGKPDLSLWMDDRRSTHECYRLAYTEGGMTMSEIARQGKTSLASVSRMIAKAESETCKT